MKKKTKGGHVKNDPLIDKLDAWLKTIQNVEISVDRFPSGLTWFDIRSDQLKAKGEMVVVEARPLKGFGISTVKSGEPCFLGADVVVTSLKKAKAEIEKRLHSETDITTFS